MIPPQDDAPVEDFEPFDPPDDYPFEEELIGDAPRRRPDLLRQGRYALRQKRLVSVPLITAAICTTVGLFPATHVLSLYFLRLPYISWIGIGFGLLGLSAFVFRRFHRGPYRYVDEGLPLVVRILGLVLRPTVFYNGQPSFYCFFAIIQYRDPATGELDVVETSSNAISAVFKDRLKPSYRVGNYATAVYLPGQFAQSLRLYGFLDLRPDLGLIRRDPERPAGWVKQALTLGAVFGIFGVLVSNLYAVSKFETIDWSWGQGIAVMIGAIGLGGPLLSLFIHERRSSRRRRDERNARAVAVGDFVEIDAAVKSGWLGLHSLFLNVLAISGCFLLCGATMLCWAFTANAMFDSSPPVDRPVMIVSVTHNFLFRESKVTYHFFNGDPRKRDCLTTALEMNRLKGPFALAEVHAGRLGWPWVKSLRPIPMDPELRQRLGEKPAPLRGPQP